MKHLISKLSIAIAFICIVTQCYAQPDFSEDPYYLKKVTYELGGSLGVMNCLTDLGGNKGVGKKFIKDLNVSNTAPAGSIYFSGAYKNAIALRTEATWGIAKASDAVLKENASNFGRHDRNLSFKTTIFELSLVTEIHPKFFKHYSQNEKMPRLSPYLLGGIGYFLFDPKTKLNGEWVALRPLSTEGQGFAEYPDRKFYKLNQINFPVGAGVKYKLSPLFNFSAECMYRILNTDYLDDVSTTYIDKSLFQKYLNPTDAANAALLYSRQGEIAPTHSTAIGGTRGNPKNNDAYFTITFKVGLIF